MSGNAFDHRLHIRERLAAISYRVACQVAGLRGKLEIRDTHDFKGHESSVIDDEARQFMLQAVEAEFPAFDGTIRCELNPFTRRPLEHEGEAEHGTLIVDELEGTTNTKRCLASDLEYNPQAGISIAYSDTNTLEGLSCSAFCTLSSKSVFSSVRVEKNEFMSFVGRAPNPLDAKLISRSRTRETRGDSRNRILVVGYSNSHRMKKAAAEEALWKIGLKTYDGCRASGVDVINLVRNLHDAYVDPRFYWSTKDETGKEKEAMLQVYDIAAVLPIALGAGMIVTDCEGKPWQSYDILGALPIVIARPAIHGKIIDALKPLVAEWKPALAAA